MAKPFDFGDIHLDVTAGSGGEPERPEQETPFRIALLGDFSGRASRGICETGAGLARRRAIEIDRDNFDEVMEKLGVELRLPIGRDGSAMTFRFRELEDFHPDRLYEQSEMFSKLREIRERLKNPKTFAAAAAELGLGGRAAAAQTTPTASGGRAGQVEPAMPGRPGLGSRAGQAEPSASGGAGRIEPPSAERLGSGSLLEQMVEQTESRGPARGPSRAPDELQEFVRRVTEPHLEEAADSRQAEVLGTIDRAIGAPMRALLHVPEFQELEAAWRAVYLLVRRVETGTELKIFLIDVSKEELKRDLGASGGLSASGLYRLLVEKSVGTPGAEPWALLVGNYAFGPERAEAELLGRLGKIASAAGAPFVAGAKAGLVGCKSFGEEYDYREWRVDEKGEEAAAQVEPAVPGRPGFEDRAAWAALRGLPAARLIGLAMPRFLLRLPYGQKSDALESFPFEEMGAEAAHEDYLWGNAAFACALLLAQSFSEAGWEMRPGMQAQIDGLPLDVRKRDGQAEAKPCAEALLTEKAAARIMEHGIMALGTLKDQDAVRVVRFQSIAEPLRALAGRWS